MDALGGFVRRIVSRTGITTSTSRRSLERELRAHLEDAAEAARAQGHGEAEIPQIVCDRFGDPDEIAREFVVAYRWERGAMALVYSLALVGISMLTVAALIWGLQLLIAIGRGVSLGNAFTHLREQVMAFGSLVLGYMGLYLQERLFRSRRLLKAFLLNSALFLFLFAVTFAGFHLTTAAPVLVFVSGIAVRLLQHTVLRSAWFLGTAVPMAAAALLAGPLAHAQDQFPFWATILVRWAGLTLACYSLTLLSQRHRLVGSSGS